MKIESHETRFNGETWVREKFIRISVTVSLIRWLNQNYGPPDYQKNYWLDWNDAIMSEKIYLHWQLVK